jgi:hypothetical protein
MTEDCYKPVVLYALHRLESGLFTGKAGE